MGSCIIQRREITQTSFRVIKTILYQPIFINPQAYFVFPSLYHIEKGDSFIEPANVTGQLIINTITEDGIYTIEDRHHFIGFGCNFVGTCNITIEQLPTSILKDLSGNGNHAYLYGGKGKLNSGMGVYKFDFLSDLLINSAYLPYTERQYDSICSLAGHPNGWLFQYKSLTDIPTFKIEVKGIVNDKFHYRWYDENGNRGVDFVIDKDGIYEFPMSYSVETNTGVGIVCNNICQDNVCFT